MSVSLKYLEQCAGETGFAVATLEKVTRLGEVAAAIASHPLLGKSLALKGGTAFNFCTGGAPTRMSVDLDYNYVAHVDREQMLVARPEVENAVEEIARRLGYRVQHSKDEFAGRKFFATYRSVLGSDDRVEVDLNFLFRVPLDGVAGAKMWQPGELDQPHVNVVSLSELCIGKLLAMLDRAAPRDAWDVARLPKIAGDLLQSDRFRVYFVAMSAILAHPVSTYSRNRMKQRLTAELIEQQLVPMLATGTPPNVETLIDEAWRVVMPLVELNPRELDYISAVEHGELRPEILIPETPDLAKIIAMHPAIRWKIENVRKHRRRKNPM